MPHPPAQDGSEVTGMPDGNNRPRAVVSDLGGVFVRVDMSPLRELLARSSGLGPDEAWRRVWEDSAWARHQRGEISTGELVREGGRRLGADIDEDAFTRAWCSIFPGLMDGIAELYREVRSRGLTVSLGEG